MSKLDQRGVVHLLVPLILLLGIIGGVYLITAGPLKLFPKATVSGPIGGVTYVDAKIGCGNPQGLTPDQICREKGFNGAIPDPRNYEPAIYPPPPPIVAKGYWWRQCGGASVSNCTGLNCTVNELDCTNTAGYWGSQQPYPENYIKTGGPITVYNPDELGIPCAGYSPGWTMRVACSLATATRPAPSSLPSPAPSCTLDQLRAIFGARRGDSNFNPACDINNDGRISVTDYSALVSRPISSSTPPFSGSIPPSSPFSPAPSPTPQVCTFNDLRAAYFAKRGDPKYNPACDFNNDGSISISDFVLLRRR